MSQQTELYKNIAFFLRTVQIKIGEHKGCSCCNFIIIFKNSPFNVDFNMGVFIFIYHACNFQCLQPSNILDMCALCGIYYISTCTYIYHETLIPYHYFWLVKGKKSVLELPGVVIFRHNFYIFTILNIQTIRLDGIDSLS